MKAVSEEEEEGSKEKGRDGEEVSGHETPLVPDVPANLLQIFLNRNPFEQQSR